MKRFVWLVGVLVVRPATYLTYLATPRKRLPPIDNPILTMQAQDIARAVRTRKVCTAKGRRCMAGFQTLASDS